jgi:hypothetical protein
VRPYTGYASGDATVGATQYTLTHNSTVSKSQPASGYKVQFCNIPINTSTPQVNERTIDLGPTDNIIQ